MLEGDSDLKIFRCDGLFLFLKKILFKGVGNKLEMLLKKSPTLPLPKVQFELPVLTRCIHPMRRFLAICNQENVSDPVCIFCYTSK